MTRNSSSMMRRTKRLIVRSPHPSDAASMAAYCQRNRAHLERFEPAYTSERFETAFWVSAFERSTDEFKAGSSCRTLLFEPDDRTVIGTANLTNIVRSVFQACYLGYSIDAQHEGQGLMREALVALIDYAFRDLHLHRIMANYLPWNRRSQKLLEGLGFAIEGYAKRYLYINGEWQDHILTALTNDGWKAEPTRNLEP